MKRKSQNWSQHQKAQPTATKEAADPRVPTCFLERPSITGSVPVQGSAP